MNKVAAGVHDQNKASKQVIHKSKKKGAVKVVYISNPMKVNTSASQFRALVQQLTGRDADHHMPALPSSFLQHSNNIVHNKEHEEQVLVREKKKVHKEEDEQAAVLTSNVQDGDKLSVPSTALPHLADGSDLLSLQDINGYFSPSNFWYEESAFHVDASKL